MQNLIVDTLRPSQIGAAYPLIREVVPTLDMATWTRFARRTADPRRADHTGIMVAQDSGRPHPSGLFLYRKDMSLLHGPLLTADHFVALDFIDPRPVIAVLVEALERMGRRLDCTAIHSVLHGGSPDVAASLAAAGHRPEGTIFCKTLDRDIFSAFD